MYPVAQMPHSYSPTVPQPLNNTHLSHSFGSSHHNRLHIRADRKTRSLTSLTTRALIAIGWFAERLPGGSLIETRRLFDDTNVNDKHNHIQNDILRPLLLSLAERFDVSLQINDENPSCIFVQRPLEDSDPIWISFVSVNVCGSNRHKQEKQMCGLRGEL